MSLTVAFITARHEPRFDWFLDSLSIQRDAHRVVSEIIIVNSRLWDDRIIESPEQAAKRTGFADRLRHVPPKPTVWAGPSRLTRQDWWHVSNSRNTAICLCRSDWIAFLDDRCVLQRNWLGAVRNAMDRNYAVFGTYEKREAVTVEHGRIKNSGIVTGLDSRVDYVRKHRAGISPTPAPGSWAFGCSIALPLEWCLAVNGYPEECDGLSMEDVIFGMTLENNARPLRFDLRMAVVQDRTSGRTSPAISRSSKERHPNDETDKGHEALRRFGKQKRSSHHWNIREIRDQVLAGQPFPAATHPTHDWYDNQPLTEFDGKRIN